MRTEAAVLTRVGGPLEVLEVVVPSLAPGQVLVEVNYSGVCGTQLGEVEGTRGDDPWLPHCLGHEGTGVVLEVGPQVTMTKAGDNVVLSWIQGPGLATAGAKYEGPTGPVNSGPVATLLRHAVVGESRLTVVPPGLSPRAAVALGCPAPTGMGSIRNVLGIDAGESLVVFGAGGVGLFAILEASESQAKPIVCVDPLSARRRTALEWGATHALDPAGPDLKDRLTALLGSGARAVVDATGNPEVLRLAIDLAVPRGGQVVVVGNAPYGSSVSIDPQVFNQGKSIRGTWGGDASPALDFPWMAERLAGSAAKVESLYSDPYRLADVNEAFAAMANGTIGRALIDMALI